jgi:hypothetical protein
MTGPLVVLAFLALVAGFVGIPHVIHLSGTLGDIGHFLPEWVGLSTKPMEMHLSSGTTYALLGTASVVGLLGIGLAYALYGKGPSKIVDRFTAGPPASRCTRRPRTSCGSTRATTTSSCGRSARWPRARSRSSTAS